MVVIGLLLVLLAIGAGVFIVYATWGSSASVSIEAGNVGIDMSPLVLYLAGAATLLLLVLGWALFTLGLRRSRAKRREIKELKERAAARPDASDRTRSDRGTDRRTTDRSVTDPGVTDRGASHRGGSGSTPRTGDPAPPGGGAQAAPNTGSARGADGGEELPPPREAPRR